jgi:predicted DNA-binding transcriptional regulator YafY
MRRADRLFRIVQHLRGGRLVTARRLAEALEVSERTIYRDIVDLQASGVPVDGAAGVGYVMRGGFELPPLMFSRDEIVALVAGARLIRAWGGAAMAQGAEEALVEIAAVLPEAERHRAASIAVHSFATGMTEGLRARIDEIESAVEQRAVLVVGYTDQTGVVAERRLRPLSLFFWGKVWTLVAWCELRRDFRMFRLDRIGRAEATGETFRVEDDKSLRTVLRQMEAEGCGSGRL